MYEAQNETFIWVNGINAYICYIQDKHRIFDLAHFIKRYYLKYRFCDV